MTARTAPRSMRLVRMGMTAAVVATLSVFGSGVAIAADRSIEMQDFAFSPQTVEIRVGDRVTWTNRDSVEHNATNGSFDTGLLAEGKSASIRFLAAGTYAFFCEPHPSMTGTVIVRSVAAPATDTADGLAALSEGGDARLGVVLGALALGTLVGLRLVARRDGSPACGSPASGSPAPGSPAAAGPSTAATDDPA